jgi:cell division inhibitor SepF
VNIFTKLRDFVGFNESEEYEYYEEEADGTDYPNAYQEETPAPAEEERTPRRRHRDRTTVNPATEMTSSTPRNNVIGMPGAAAGFSEVLVFEPRSFEEMPQVIQALRERKSVVLNLTIIDPDEAQRAVDFVAGGTYAIDGHQERIGESIFLFTPSCVQVTTQAGTLHEAPPVAVAPPRSSVPQPQSWTLDETRLAQ